MNKSTFWALVLTLCICSMCCYAQNVIDSDEICGKWISAEKNLIVEVYKDNNEYKGKLVWFDDPDEDRDIHQYYDIANPDPALRNRKLLGINVLDNLAYNPQTQTWENGTIYDASSGKEYSSAISITHHKSLKVTGYWKFKFIGRSMLFNKFNSEVAKR